VLPEEQSAGRKKSVPASTRSCGRSRRLPKLQNGLAGTLSD
jgi:hypothetical protein